MKLPRDISGEKLAILLSKYGYSITRQTGSHMRLTSIARGHSHHVTIPNHSYLKIGTLQSVISEVAGYLEVSKQTLQQEIFK